MAKKNASSGPGLLAGIILSVAGLLLLAPVLLIVGIVLIVRNRGAFAEKTAAPKRQPRPPRPHPVKPAPRQSVGASYHSYAKDHYHITSAGLPAEKRLEQLEVMRNAGLLDKEEYQLRLRKILRNK